MSAESLGAAAARHAALRWIGAPLLVTGLFGLLSALLGLAGGGPSLNVGLGLAGTALALTSFGVNSDTALALALQAQESRHGGPSPLSPKLAEELAGELARDRSAVGELRAAPIVSLITPLLAAGVQVFLALRLLGA
jgi:hypothetical protein